MVWVTVRQAEIGRGDGDNTAGSKETLKTPMTDNFLDKTGNILYESLKS
jgi:hypothetical protein